LFRYDGTAAPALVAGSPSSPGKFTEFNDRLYFTGVSGGFSSIYSYDGVNPPVAVPGGPEFPYDYTVFGSALYFTARDPGSGGAYRLFRYDGASAPVPVPGSPGSPNGLTVYAGALHFSGDDGTAYRLYRYDGVNPPAAVPGSPVTPSDLSGDIVEFDGALYFRAGATAGGGLVRYEDAGNVFEQYGTPPLDPASLVVHGDDLYFATADTAGDSRLWALSRVPVVVPAAPELPPTGAERGPLALAGATVVALGVGLLVVRRRAGIRAHARVAEGVAVRR